MIAQLLIVMMQRAHEKDPSAFTVLLLRISEISYLYGYAKDLYQEHAAEDRYQPLLADDDRQGRNDAAESETAGIAHKDLRRVGVIPKESYTGPDEGADIDRQLAQVGDVHDVEVFGKPD